MKLNKFIFGMTLGAFLIPTISLATPRKHSDCKIQVKKPDGAGPHFFSKDCRTVYVAPPKSGLLSVENFDPAPAIKSECSVIADAKAEAAVNQADSLKLAKMRSRAIDRAAELDELLDKGMVPDGETEISVMEKISKLTEQASKLKKQMDESFNADYKKIDRFANEVGGDGFYSMDNGFEQLVKEYARLNEDTGLNFKELTLDQSYLNFNEKSYEDANAPGHRLVLEVDIPGIGGFPVLSALGTFIEEGNLVEYEKVPDGAVLFNGGMVGEVLFSKVGACAVLEDIGEVDAFSMSDVKGKLKANASYQYQVQVTRKYAVTYNLKDFWQRVQKQGKRGGFFSTKSFSSLVDTKRSDSWITFHNESQDQRFEYSDEDIKEIKKEFIDRAIKQAMAAKTNDPKAYLTLLNPPEKNGSTVIGEELSKCPHLYCQIGAAGFRILGSIFGSSEASSNFIQKFDQTTSETVTSDRMVTQFGTTGFK